MDVCNSFVVNIYLYCYLSTHLRLLLFTLRLFEKLLSAKLEDGRQLLLVKWCGTTRGEDKEKVCQRQLWYKFQALAQQKCVCCYDSRRGHPSSFEAAEPEVWPCVWKASLILNMFRTTRTSQAVHTKPSTETRRVLPGRSSAGVEDRLPRCVHPLDDQVVQHHLLLGPLDDLLLHGAFGYQTVDVDLQGEAVRWAQCCAVFRLFHYINSWSYTERSCRSESVRFFYDWLTCLFWPILCALACACRSFCGFQSESKMTTVSADARLMPRPPARVDNKKQKSWGLGGGEVGAINMLLS